MQFQDSFRSSGIVPGGADSFVVEAIHVLRDDMRRDGRVLQRGKGEVSRIGLGIADGWVAQVRAQPVRRGVRRHNREGLRYRMYQYRCLYTGRSNPTTPT